MLHRITKHKQVRFLLIGGTNFAWGLASYPIFYWILHPLGVNYLVILVITYVINTLISFFTQKYFVFKSQGNHFRELLKFFGVQLIFLAANLIILPLLVAWTQWNPIIAQTLFACCLMVFSYFLHNSFTFRGNTGTDEESAASSSAAAETNQAEKLPSGDQDSHD